MKLLLVDGTNIVMRCAWGGDIAPPEAVTTAAAMIDRVARESQASHMVVAFDFPGEPTWRHQLYPQYKANRTRDTSEWIIAAGANFAGRGWRVELEKGFEADNTATETRWIVRNAIVAVLSGDSDLLPLTVSGVEVLKPLLDKQLQRFSAADVMEKYRIPAAHLLYDYKAMVGETGENIPGVPGIGPKRAADLLSSYGSLEKILAAGSNEPTSIGPDFKWACRVAEHSESALLSLKLVSLNPDAPVQPIIPSTCALRARAA